MTEPLLQDSEQVVQTIRERNEMMLAAVRQTQRELVDAFERTLCSVADSGEKLADTSEVEWVSRMLRARAAFSRDLADASCKFARELLEM
jgi:hypothetical protein